MSASVIALPSALFIFCRSLLKTFVTVSTLLLSPKGLSSLFLNRSLRVTLSPSQAEVIGIPKTVELSFHSWLTVLVGC